MGKLNENYHHAKLDIYGIRQTDKEVGRQHHGMDRPGICQVPEGCGEQGKMKETGCEIISGALG